MELDGNLASNRRFEGIIGAGGGAAGSGGANGSAAAEQSQMVKNMLAELILTIKEDILDSISGAMDTSFTRMGSQMVGRLERYDVGVQTQFD